jgi:hypothetical protein
MKNILTILFFSLFGSCGSQSITEIDGLTKFAVFHEECTGCLDATILEKSFEYPDSLKSNLTDAKVRDILLQGKNPYAKKDFLSNLFSGDYLKSHYMIYGYFTGIDSTNNPYGKVAVFYVVKYEAIKN